MNRPVLLYDADCGFCTAVVGWARRAALRADLVALTPQSAAALGVDWERAQVEVPYVDVAGQVGYGASAIVAALTACRFPPSLLGRLATPLAPALQPLYRLIARNRQWLPGGTVACSLPTAPDQQISGV